MTLVFKLPEKLPDTPSIVKISCNGKYYIAKTRSIPFLKSEIQNTFGKYAFRGGVPETNLYYILVKWLNKQDKPKIDIQVLFTSENGYEVLKFELEQLMQHFGNKDCLNQNNIPYIPKTQVMKKGSNWLTQNQALNFRKLLTKYNY